jgi:hypothetical protein
MRELVVRELFEPRIYTVEIQLKDEFWDLPFSMLESSHLVPLNPPHSLGTWRSGLGEFRSDSAILRDGVGLDKPFEAGDTYGLGGNGQGVHELWYYQRIHMKRG